MNVGAYRGGRPEFYDRAPISRSQVYSASSIGPHGATTRWTYTVPAGKRAWCDTVVTTVTVEVAAAAVVFINGAITYQPNGGTAMKVAETFNKLNTPYDTTSQVVTGLGLMQAGDILQASTYNPNTGGSNSFNVNAKLTEYDI